MCFMRHRYGSTDEGLILYELRHLRYTYPHPARNVARSLGPVWVWRIYFIGKIRAMLRTHDEGRAFLSRS